MSEGSPPADHGGGPCHLSDTASDVDGARPRRSWLGAAGLYVLGRWGARVALAWIVLLVLMAVFAPFLASSHPLLWKADGSIESPLLNNLTPSDVVLLVALFAAAALAAWPRWVRRWSADTDRAATGNERFAAWIWLIAVVSPFIAHRPLLDSLYLTEGGNATSLATFAAAAGLLISVILAIAIPLVTRPPRRFAIVVASGAGVLAVLFLLLPVHPPDALLLSKYREAQAEGRVEWAIMTPLTYSPTDRQQDVLSREGEDPRLRPPSVAHPMGTTVLGEDVASRMLHACRIALAIGLIATGIAAVIGIVVGALLGYFSGTVDLLGMRLVEVFSAIPTIFLLIMIVAFYGRNIYLIMSVIGLLGWMGYAVFVRAEFLKLRKADYVAAAQAIGVPLPGILFRHMLPNGVTPVLVLASFGIASAILTESTLSFIGLGLIEEPSWGALLNQATDAGSHWGLRWFPGLAIFLTVFAYNVLGEALRDALDPRTAGADA